ncbi:MAG: hypothetical protein QCI00_09295 [Candidatus Thermoplasmatota archaeon]|nr:hypothetical protein [Candidatus Thermoplasmatota archaeon]
MNVGMNQLFLLEIAKKKGWITVGDVCHVYGFATSFRSVQKAEVIISKLEFKGLIQKTEGTAILRITPVTKYILTKGGEEALDSYHNRGETNE